MAISRTRYSLEIGVSPAATKRTPTRLGLEKLYSQDVGHQLER